MLAELIARRAYLAAGTAVTGDTATTEDTAAPGTATDPYDPRFEDVVERVAAR